MTTTELPPAALDRAAGVELLGPVQGSGYRDEASLVRRADGQMVQLGPLLYGLLACVDGRRDAAALADAMTERLDRPVTTEAVQAIAGKLAAQGLLAGSEAETPARANPLLALRWKVLVTNPAWTRRLTAPFAALFAPWLLWPVLAAFAAICWYVLFDKGLASATAQAFTSPGLLLAVFALAVVSAGIHELGHAAACRYGGATPGGMGAGLYLVYPAFYTDVTDAYRLPRKDRLRVDLGGLYFNALVAVVTTAVWLAVRRDALLLLVAMQLLQMVRQLSPVIRADGYHILADATGVPDLFAHIGPTLRRLIPGRRREPSALRGRTRALVTAWVLIVVPVLASLAVGAVLLLPRLVTTAWQSGHHIAAALPHQAGRGDVLGVLAALLELFALLLPVVGSTLIAVRLGRTASRRAWAWSQDRPVRRAGVSALAGLLVAGLAWAWWPAGQYQPVRASERGTIGSLVGLVTSPHTAYVAPGLRAGRTIALAMVPQGGPTAEHPALLVLPGAGGAPAQAVVVGGGSAVAFPFTLPGAPGPHGTQALAVNTTDGGVRYDVEYALVTVTGGAPVDESNAAYAVASCQACTTVAVSFQVVLVVGQSNVITPANGAAAVNYRCPSCVTTALADQLVITLSAAPSAQLQQQLEAALAKLGDLQDLGSGGTPAAIAAAVAAVQQQIQADVAASGLEVTPAPSPSAAANSAAPASGAPGGSAAPSDSATPAAAPGPSGSASPGSTPSASPSPSTSTGPSPTPTPSATP